MDFTLAAQQFMAVNIQYGLTYLLDIHIGCDISDEATRKKLIEQTLLLWTI